MGQLIVKPAQPIFWADAFSEILIKRGKTCRLHNSFPGTDRAIARLNQQKPIGAFKRFAKYLICADLVHIWAIGVR